MATGIPAVVTRATGVAELITDGVDGVLLTSPRSECELASKLVPILNSERMRSEMGQNARRTAERYSWDRIASMSEEVYSRALQVRVTRPQKLPRSVQEPP